MPDEFLTDLPRPYQQEISGAFELAANHWEGLGAPYSACLALVCDLERCTAEHVHRALKLAGRMEANAVLNKITRLGQQQGLLTTPTATKQAASHRLQSHPLGLNAR